MALHSENASVYQPRSRFAAEAATPAQQERAERAAAEALLPAADAQEPVPMEVDSAQPRQAKGLSAPAILTTQSWPELVREAQALIGPIQGMCPQVDAKHPIKCQKKAAIRAL